MPKEMARPARALLSLTALVGFVALLVNAGLMSQRLVQEALPALVLAIFGCWAVYDTIMTTRAPRRVAAGLAGSGPVRVSGDERASLLLRAVAVIWVMLLALLVNRTGLAATHYQVVPVLTYHRVGKAPHPGYPVPVVSPQEFERQMAFLSRHGYHTVSPRELIDFWQGRTSKLPARPILITFDDGWRDNYRNAYPILKKHQFTGVIFVTTGELGQRAMLRWSEVAELARAGFTIGVHGDQHLRFGKLSPGERSAQMKASLRELRRRSGIVAYTFAYPYGDGDLDEAVWSDVGRSGIRVAFASHNFGLNVRPPKPLAVRRVLMNGNRWLSDPTLNLLLW